MKAYEISALNGSKNPRKIKLFVIQNSNGYSYYVEEGGTIVNKTYEQITENTNICDLHDVDCFTWDNPITTLEELEEAVMN